MLTEYIEKAMYRASYEVIDDQWVGQIPGFDGVWAYEDTEEKCRKLLREVLEGWLLLQLRDRDPLPVMDDIDLNAAGVESEVA